VKLEQFVGAGVAERTAMREMDEKWIKRSMR
jgi:hypothetical protein